MEMIKKFNKINLEVEEDKHNYLIKEILDKVLINQLTNLIQQKNNNNKVNNNLINKKECKDLNKYIKKRIQQVIKRKRKRNKLTML
jgi:hypothetical protein